ncbi:MAG: hypothetical protein AAFX55_15405 [Bacteroidota bacterium]
MKNGCNPLDKPSLLYIIIEEMLFLKETRKLSEHLTSLLTGFFGVVKVRYHKFIRNEWTQAFLMLTAQTVLATIVLLIAYELVIIF